MPTLVAAWPGNVEKGTPMKIPDRLPGLVAGILAILLAITLLAPPAAQAEPRQFSITITHVSCVDPCYEEGLEAALEGYPDFYARLFFNGVSQPRTPRVDDQRSINPNWVISTQVPADAEFLDIAIQIWDWDHVDDDNGDTSQRDGDSNLDIRVPLLDNR